MARIKYFNTTTQEWEYADGLSGGGGSGVTSAMSESLWALLEKTEYVTAPTDAELTAFKAAWGLKYLASISAVYSGGNVAAGTNVEELRDNLVVTANYSDGTTETITDYLLAGVLYEGENTVTVTYQLKTTTFTVTAEVGKMYLYKDGVLDTDVTGGLVSVNSQYHNNNAGVDWNQGAADGVPVYGENSFELAIPRNSYNQKTYRTANKIDLTNFTSIHILGNATLSTSGELSHDVTDANTETVIYGVTQGSNNSNWATNIGYRGAETIVDVSELTGEYYFISAMRKGSSWGETLTQTVSTIWLE